MTNKYDFEYSFFYHIKCCLFIDSNVDFFFLFQLVCLWLVNIRIQNLILKEKQNKLTLMLNPKLMVSFLLLLLLLISFGYILHLVTNGTNLLLVII